MIDRRQMRRIPSSEPGPRNDLADELDEVVTRLMTDPTARLHAFGTRWRPEPHLRDQVFGFLPGNGIHDVHMNQGNRDEHWRDNGVWSDGGLIFHEPERDRWSAVVLALQNQTCTPATRRGASTGAHVPTRACQMRNAACTRQTRPTP